MIDKLARVHWQLGQPLLPEHFFIQEEALLADAELRSRNTGLPHYGLSEMEWRAPLLDDGILSLIKLTIKTPSGLLLAVPGNAKLTSPLNLKNLGGTRAQVYCHVLKPQEAQETQTSYDSDETEVIARSQYELHLSCDPAFSGALESIKIIEFRKGPEENWELSESYLPPLMLIGTSPFLKSPLKALFRQLDVFRKNLINETASTLSAENLASSRNCQEAVFNIQRFLLNLENHINVHPYELYNKLLTFYGSICNYHNNSTIQASTIIYRHEHLAQDFKKIFELLINELRSSKSRVPYLPFLLENGRFQCKIPTEVREASTAYLLIQKKHIQLKINIKDLKVVSPSRSSLIHKLALPGIPSRRVEQLPFQHSFGSEVEFYELQQGEEWDYCLQELGVTFYSSASEEDMTPYLYWRRG